MRRNGAKATRHPSNKVNPTKTIVLAVLGVAFPGMALAESATFEVDGFPVSLHQAQVTGFADLHEMVAAPIVFERDGFPASPVQMLVLGPRRVKQHEDAAVREETRRSLLTRASTSDH